MIIKKYTKIIIFMVSVALILCSCSTQNNDNLNQACVSIVNGIDAARSMLIDDVSVGSGFFYKPGYILTANHNVTDSSYAVTFDGDIHETETVYNDTINDIAILKIQSTEYPCFEIELDYSVGDEVFCFCTPKTVFLQGTYLTGKITNNDINGLANQYLLQTDLPLSPGCSGSAILNENGNVIAMNAFKSTEFGTESLSFGIKGDKLLKAINSLGESADIQKFYIELSENLNNSYGLFLQSGLTVKNIPEDSALYNKLQPSDVIMSVNGINLYTCADFFENITEDATIVVIRNNETLTIEMK